MQIVKNKLQYTAFNMTLKKKLNQISIWKKNDRSKVTDFSHSLSLWIGSYCFEQTIFKNQGRAALRKYYK